MRQVSAVPTERGDRNADFNKYMEEMPVSLCATQLGRMEVRDNS